MSRGSLLSLTSSLDMGWAPVIRRDAEEEE